MMKTLSLVLAGYVLVSTSVFAADCGEPPMDEPPVPNGAVADADQIRDSRDAILEYSKKVDEYLTCMDQRAAKIMPYLTKDQQARWDEDLAAVHERRRQLQIRMNEAIRSYRRAQAG
ncbi:hypothetical protein [Kordiimonas lacus]|nr:hypothetical protein [Kordiimonas lacus]